MKRWLIGGLAIAMVAVGGYLALDQYAQKRAPIEVDALIAANGLGPGSRGTVSYSLWRDRLAVEDVELQATDPAALGWRKLQTAHLEVSGIDPLRIKALLKGHWEAFHRQPAPDRLDFRGFSLETSDGILVHAEQMTVTEPGFQAVALSATAPGPIRTLAGLAARSLDASEIKITAHPPQGTSDIAVATLTARDIGEGRVGALDLQHIASNGPSRPGNGLIRISVEGVTVRGLDHRAVIDLVYDTQNWEEPLSPLWDDITVSAGPITDQGGEMKFDRLALGGIKAKRAASLHDAMNSFAVAKAELDAFDLKVLKDHPAHVTLNKLRFSDIEPGRVGSASLENVAIEAEKDAQMTLGGFDLQDLSYGDWSKIGSLEDLMKLGQKPPRISLRHLGLGSVAVNQRGKEIGSLASLEARMTQDESGLPVASSLKLDKLSLSREVLSQGAVGQEIAALGYDRLAADFSADCTYDTATSGLVLRETFSVGPQVGRVMFSIRLANVPTGLESGTPDEQLRRLFGVTIEQGELRYEDDSLAERLLRRNAAKAGMSPDQMREALLNQLGVVKQSMPSGSRNAAMIDAVAGFLRQPQSLTLSMDPPRPVSLQQFLGTTQARPMDMPGLLGLSLH